VRVWRCFVKYWGLQVPPEIPVSPVSLNHEPVAGGAGKYNDTRPVAYDEVELNITYLGGRGPMVRGASARTAASTSFFCVFEDHFPRRSQLYTTLHTVLHVLLGAPMLIGG